MVFKRTSVTSIAWILAVLVTALLVNVDSIRGWVAAGFFAVGPLVILMHFGRELAPTTSQNIQEARR